MTRVLGIAAIALATYWALQLFAGNAEKVVYQPLPPELAAPEPAADAGDPPPRGDGRPPLVTDAVRERVTGYMQQEAARQPR
jgi:hypothetical protein